VRTGSVVPTVLTGLATAASGYRRTR
jgi:hypothetical protein